MELLLSLIIGLLYAGAVYLIMRRHIVKVIIGLALLSHAANLLIFTSAGLSRTAPPIIPPGMDVPETAISDPLPQALILTAIVISFAVLAFALILFHRAYQSAGSDNLDDLNITDSQ
jgi:multicomponent Na+:H+ antiporter subunit C